MSQGFLRFFFGKKRVSRFGLVVRGNYSQHIIAEEVNFRSFRPSCDGGNRTSVLARLVRGKN